MPYNKEDFIALRRAIIKKDFDRMNDMQLSAVVTVKGPLLVLAGAGSGKTTVLVNRIACMVKYGDAWNSTFVPEISDSEYQRGVDFANGLTNELPYGAFSVYAANPWEILAITFTNKAANELKNRISAKLGEKANDIWAGTFHSICARILRRYGDFLGYSSHFTIYDTDDQKRVIKDVLKQLDISEKELPIKYVMNEISRSKDSLISPEEYISSNFKSFYPMKRAAGEVYNEYQKRLKAADAMDFDDIIFNTVKLFKKNSEILEYYANKFKYIMVDEYQDTNHAQYVLVSMLASLHQNICVVGDDDQSIYSFRGATIENILSFEDNFPNAKVIRLEQNYRSTATILDAANAVIANNKGRKGKKLWTSLKDDSKIKVHTLNSEQDEAKFVAETILSNVQKGEKFNQNAVLYRMNALSSTIENVFVRSGIPYRIVGGHRFFDRKEIKDVVAYLNVINNPNDSVRLKRIINEPKRGIGETTVKNAEEVAAQLGISLFEVFANANDYPILSRSAAKLTLFTQMINELADLADTLTIEELFDELLSKSGYMAALRAEGEASADRVDNVNELRSGIINYQNEAEEPSLSEYLEEVALISDIDSYNSDEDYVVLMTLHSAKGLEFDNVFLVGLEENVFPGAQTIYGGDKELEEERRLAYVGITRAKRQLYITNAYTRMLYGSTNRNTPSRFLREIPTNLCEISGSNNYNPWDSKQKQSGGYASDYGRYSGSYGGGYSAQGGSTYSAPKSTYRVSGASTASASKTQYTKGMRVRHKAFGDGTVINTTPMGGDCLLEIAFDNRGTKKLMSNFVKMEIL
ncbi:MAG: UvrD-helicase domain-containing protein [Clostridia bacterium]|nr:UvrD-helicase domain-containing protein [Clostridia bacterium]